MMNTFSLTVLLLMAFALPGCRDQASETGIAGEAYGTAYRIQWVMDGVVKLPEEIQRQVEDSLAEVDALLSSKREDSEISHINRQVTAEWITVSPPITDLLSTAHRVYEHSGGCYDPTIAPLLDLWNVSNSKFPDA